MFQIIIVWKREFVESYLLNPIMKRIHFLFLILFVITTTLIIAFNRLNDPPENKHLHQTGMQAYSSISFDINKISEVPLPQGFERIDLRKDSFGEWLHNFKLRKNNTVCLY